MTETSVDLSRTGQGGGTSGDQIVTLWRKAIINNGTVDNVILASDDFAPDGVMLVASETAQIGQIWDGQTFSWPPPDLSRLQADILTATQSLLDEFAATRNYAGIMSACTYVNSTIPKFAAEGQFCLELRDKTWAKLYEMLAEVQAGARLIPSSVSDVAAELPVSTATWPD